MTDLGAPGSYTQERTLIPNKVPGVTRENHGQGHDVYETYLQINNIGRYDKPPISVRLREREKRIPRGAREMSSFLTPKRGGGFRMTCGIRRRPGELVGLARADSSRKSVRVATVSM